jgi:hypothetical protein
MGNPNRIFGLHEKEFESFPNKIKMDLPLR